MALTYAQLRIRSQQILAELARQQSAIDAAIQQFDRANAALDDLGTDNIDWIAAVDEQSCGSQSQATSAVDRA